jgi:methionyl aminopeptidase
MRTSSAITNTASLIILQDDIFLKNQRVAGKIAANAIKQLQWYCENKTFHSMATLDDIIGKYIINEGGICTFRGYKGFPRNFCISINQQLVHGIGGDTVLADGDLVSFDLGVTYRGAISDTALTVIFGTPKSERHVQLVKDTEEALMRGIQAIAIGKRIGCIGNAIYKYSRSKGYSVVTKYGGHGISMTVDGIGIPHSAPFVANKAEINEGVRFQSGMVLAIEPLFVIGSSAKTYTSSDGWTVNCDNICSHQEHTLYIHSDHVEIISFRDNETFLKSNKVYFQ